MRAPPLAVRVLGHPMVVAPMTCVTLFTLFLWSQQAEFAVPAILIVIATGFVGKASQHRAQYVRWRRAWAAMADGDAPSPRGPLLAKLAIAIIVPAGFLAVESGALEHASKLVAWLTLAALVGGCWAMIRRARRWLGGGVRQGRRARSASRSDVVSICARPSMRVPSLGDAYRALPEHCLRVLSPGSD